MFKRILVAVDGSDTSTKALVMATQLAREGGGQLRLLHSFDALVYLTGFEVGAGVLEAARDYAEKVLDDAMAIARAAGVPADKRLVDFPGGRLGEIVADAATAWEADLVVVGTHGRRGVGRVLLGSGAEEVIRLSRVPVLTVRGEPTRTSD